MRRLLPLVLVAGLGGIASAQDKPKDGIEMQRDLEGTVFREGLLAKLNPDNASADPNSEYRRALDAVDEFLLKDESDNNEALRDRCVAVLLQNAYVSNLSAGGVGINDSIWNILEREGVADYSRRLGKLAEQSRQALGEAGQDVTLNNDTSRIDALEDYVRHLHVHAHDILHAAAVIQPKPRTYEQNDIEDVISVIKSHKQAYDDLIAIRDLMQRNDPAVYDKLKDWKKSQKERFDEILALQERALGDVMNLTSDWTTISDGHNSYIVSQRFARQWDSMKRSVADIGRRLSGFESLKKSVSGFNVGDEVMFDVGYTTDIHTHITGQSPKGREAVIPAELSRVLKIGAQFRVQFGAGGNSGTYTVVGIGDALYLGSDPKKIPSLDGATGFYLHDNFAAGSHHILLENEKWK